MASKLVEAEQYVAKRKGGEKLIKAANIMHNILLTKLSQGDDNTAQMAEEFFNWLLYEPTNSVKDALIKKNPQLQNAINKFKDLSLKTQIMQEITKGTFGTFEEEALKTIAGNFYTNRGLITEQILKDIVNSFFNGDELIISSGQQQATVKINETVYNILKKTDSSLEKEIKDKINKDKFFTYAGKDAKADLSKGEFEFSYYINEKYGPYLFAAYQVLSNSSIKNVNDIKKIDLEDVDVTKAYAAFMRFGLENNYISDDDLKIIFNDYYINRKLKTNPYVTLHLNHLIKVYAFSGFGTSLVSDINDISNGVSYIVAINNNEKRVKVVSAKKIINYLMGINRIDNRLVTKVNINLTNI